MSKKIIEKDLLPLLRNYINQIKKGKHLQKNGNKIKPGSIRNYLFLEKILKDFSIEKVFHLRIKVLNNVTRKQFEDEKRYWRSFYHALTNYMYDDLDHFDNYVGSTIKLLRAFFNYLNYELGLNFTFHKRFYVPHEEIEIVVLSHERLNYLIFSKAFESELNAIQKRVKDVFVFGSIVALRYSDLMNLKPTNVEKINDRYYIRVVSRKTNTFTRVKLPHYAVQILKGYSGKERLLPYFNETNLNIRLKRLMESAGFTEGVSRSRTKRGIPVFTKGVRFCDLVTTHTMRRTGITTMLSLGMNQEAVRKISGHAPNSKEFLRYVSFSQSYIDSETDAMHEKLQKKRFDYSKNR